MDVVVPRWIAAFSLVLVMASSFKLLPEAKAFAAPSEANLCFGQVPTIVGTAGEEEVVGTNGPDVIVTHGADEVDARDGDDLVCVTGEAPFYGAIVSLGPGADRLLGSSSEPEIVYANDEAAGEGDRDIIDTRGGDDTVVTGGEATDAGVGEDVVALGAGRDLLRVTGPVSAATLMGGNGRDEMYLEVEPSRGVAVTIDNRRGQLIVDGVAVMSWISLERFSFSGIVDGPFTFLGTSSPEGIVFPFFVDDRWKVDVRMGGGQDKVEVYGGAIGSRFDGGRGADRLTNHGLGGVMYGRAGNDHLVGSDDGDDILIGGRGYDIATGGGGFDRCKTEVRILCER